MKINRIAAIAAVLSIAASSSLWASPPGKHAVDKIPHRHGAAKGATTTAPNHTILKRIGPPGKGHVFTRANSR